MNYLAVASAALFATSSQMMLAQGFNGQAGMMQTEAWMLSDQPLIGSDQRFVIEMYTPAQSQWLNWMGNNQQFNEVYRADQDLSDVEGQKAFVMEHTESSLFQMADAYWTTSPNSLLPIEYFSLATNYFKIYTPPEMMGGPQVNAPPTPPMLSNGVGSIFMTVDNQSAGRKLGLMGFDNALLANSGIGSSRRLTEAEARFNNLKAEICSAAVEDLRRPRGNAAENFIQDFEGLCLFRNDSGNLLTLNQEDTNQQGRCWEAYSNFQNACYAGLPAPSTMPIIEKMVGLLFVVSENGEIRFLCTATAVAPGKIATAAHCLKNWIGDGIIYDPQTQTGWRLFYASPQGERLDGRIDISRFGIEAIERYFLPVLDIAPEKLWGGQDLTQYPFEDLPPEYEPMVLTVEQSAGLAMLPRELTQDDDIHIAFSAPEQFDWITIRSFSLFSYRLFQLRSRMDGNTIPGPIDFLANDDWLRLLKTDLSNICVIADKSGHDTPQLGHFCQTNGGSSGALMFGRIDDAIQIVGMHISAPGLDINTPANAPDTINNLGTELSDHILFSMGAR